MGYKAIYRRFRPETFDDLVGQDNVVRTLQNQIKNNNIAHAYLFSGIRGTGKTSAAKIFARAVNCLNPQDGNPCNKCEICKGIISESIMDIAEIDAASNNKVDDIRELKENSNYPPSKARYKVYIVDEVHMLSKGAFNAFLKTLEEPPEYVIFILATTEENKIPATILSRCQRYEFKRIGSAEIVNNMKKICAEIGVEAEDSALSLIARNSGGGMRDALSILDQCLANNEERLTLNDVIESIGSVDSKFLREIAADIIGRNAVNIVYKFDRLMKSGKDLNIFLKELISFFRDMMIIKTGVNYEDILEISDEDIEEIKYMAEDVSNLEIIDYIEKLVKIEESMKETNQPKTVLEVSLLKLTESSSVEELNLRIEKLEQIIKSGKIQVETVKNQNDDKRDIEDNRLVPPMKAKEDMRERPQSNQPDYGTDEIEKKEDNSLIDANNIEFNDIIGKWNEFLAFVRVERPSLGALLNDGRAKSFQNGILTFAYSKGFEFHKDAVNNQSNKEIFKNLLKKFFHCDMELHVAMDYENSVPKEIEPPTAPEASDIPEEPDMQEIFELFGNERVTVE